MQTPPTGLPTFLLVEAHFYSDFFCLMGLSELTLVRKPEMAGPTVKPLGGGRFLPEARKNNVLFGEVIMGANTSNLSNTSRLSKICLLPSHPQHPPQCKN